MKKKVQCNNRNMNRKIKSSGLITANAELAFQHEEKEKRAAELVVANKELVFQNEEKEKRAAELVIANRELVFQNEEKEKRAAELVIANKELTFQNEEKEKRAAELVIANKELAFQNEEKAKRAAELIIANKLAFQNKELEQFAYVVSHDLQEPLRTIISFAGLINEEFKGKLDEHADKYLGFLLQASLRMQELVKGLLDYSRIGKDRKSVV
jgi:signal transduction histidine kinase